MEKENSLTKRYLSWTDEGKTMFWLIVVDLGVFLILCPFFVFSNMGLPLGWLLGSVTVCLCYFSMIKGSAYLLRPSDDPNARNKTMALAAVFSILRLLFMAGVLIFAAFMTFKVEGKFVNFFTTAAAYLPLIIVAAVFALTRKKKGKPSLKQQAKPELEAGEEALDD